MEVPPPYARHPARFGCHQTPALISLAARAPRLAPCRLVEKTAARQNPVENAQPPLDEISCQLLEMDGTASCAADSDPAAPSLRARNRRCRLPPAVGRGYLELALVRTRGDSANGKETLVRDVRKPKKGFCRPTFQTVLALHYCAPIGPSLRIKDSHSANGVHVLANHEVDAPRFPAYDVLRLPP
jgi:hypothetical protein